MKRAATDLRLAIQLRSEVSAMDDAKVRRLEATVAGLLVAQQVIIDALINHNAIGYPQLHKALSDAETQLGEIEGEVGAAALLPLRKLLHSLDILHAPHARQEKTPHPSWTQAMRDSLAAI